MSTNAQFPLEGTRKAMYAGSWYESDGERLNRQLKELLDDAEKDLPAEQNKGRVLAIVSPHAGYVFSGKTAAYGYQSARKQKIKRVFLLGPSHHVGFHGVALPMAISFATPLGELQVDKDVLAELKEYALFSVQPEVHRVEHSLELQLPLIQAAFGDVKIVPLVIGVLQDQSEVRLIAEILKGFISKDDLIVVSSDFTHFGPRYGYRPFHTDIKQNIAKLDKEAFSFLEKSDLDGFMDFQRRTQDTICGYFPCAILCALLPQGTKASLLKYMTSQDTMVEDTDNSVSYLSISFAGEGWPDNPGKRATADETIQLTANERKSLVSLARKTIEYYVKNSKAPTLEELGFTPNPAMKACYGVFVTIYKRHPGVAHKPGERLSRDEKDLRGCIGGIWPVRPLYSAVIENAIASCSRDYRFDPVTVNELPQLDVEVSILTPPRRVESYKDIVLGKDGIILSKHSKQSVFLPFVPTEFGWDLSETLRQLSLKAGLRDDDWKEGAKFDLFQAIEIEE